MIRYFILTLFLISFLSIFSQFENLNISDNHFPILDEKPNNVKQIDYFTFQEDSLSFEDIETTKTPDFSFFYSNNQLDSFYRKIDNEYFWDIYKDGKCFKRKTLEDGVTTKERFYFYDTLGNEILKIDSTSHFRTEIKYNYTFENGLKLKEDITTILTDYKQKRITKTIIEYKYDNKKLISSIKEDDSFRELKEFDSLNRLIRITRSKYYKESNPEIWKYEFKHDSVGNIINLDISSPHHYQRSTYKVDQKNNLILIEDEVPKKGFEMSEKEKNEFSLLINEEIEDETIYLVPKIKEFEFKYDEKGNWYSRKLKGSEVYMYRKIIYE